MPAFSFYANVIPLNSERHRALRLKPVADYKFSKKTQSVAIGAGEFFDCAVDYPIVFVRPPVGGVVPVALLGVRAEENLFVDPNGQWASSYQPAFVRRYPFITLSEADQRLSVGFDEDYKGLQEKDGERLFDDEGQPSAHFQNVLKFLDRANAEFLRAEALGKTLAEKGLLQPMQAKLSVEGGASVELGGFEVVDVAKLDALSIGEQGLLGKTGELALIHAHLVSLRNFRKLLARVESRLPKAAPAGVSKH